MLLLLAWFGALAGPVAGWWAWRRGGRGLRLAVVLAAFVYAPAVWTVLIEPELLMVRHVAVTSSAWRGPPLRIGVVSDTHIGGEHVGARRMARIAEQLTRERPDLAIFLGDYVDGHARAAARSDAQRAEIDAGLAALAGVRAPLGRVAVLGNHDWWYGGATMEAKLRKAGVTVLENSAVRVARPQGAFWVAGLADLYSTRAVASPSVALRAVPADAPVILLSHWPDPFTTTPPRVALTLAGHSHCGQMNLPIIGRPFLPSPGSMRWPCGLYDEGGRKLLVTGGVGTSVLPGRFRAPPEIVIVTLSAPP